MHEVAALLLELSAVVLGVSLLGLLAHRIEISPVPLPLLAGVGLGADGVLDLANAEPFIGPAAEIGVLLLLMPGMPLPACLALAGITWVSSSGIIARLLADLGRLGNRETPAVLSILVIEDIAMAIFLPVLIAVLTGAEWLSLIHI